MKFPKKVSREDFDVLIKEWALVGLEVERVVDSHDDPEVSYWVQRQEDEISCWACAVYIEDSEDSLVRLEAYHGCTLPWDQVVTGRRAKNLIGVLPR